MRRFLAVRCKGCDADLVSERYRQVNLSAPSF